jgi:hypothetical protein
VQANPASEAEALFFQLKSADTLVHTRHAGADAFSCQTGSVSHPIETADQNDADKTHNTKLRIG